MNIGKKTWFLEWIWKNFFKWEKNLESNKIKNSVKDKTKILLLLLSLGHWWSIGSSNIRIENDLKLDYLDKNGMNVDTNSKIEKIFEMDDLIWSESEITNSAENEYTKSTEGLAEKKFPPTDYFWWIKLSRTATYNVSLPNGTEKLRRTWHACATNPTYKNALVMTQSGGTRRETHRETYYTTRSFPVSNIEWRIRSVLNDDRKRKWLNELPKNQKIRYVGRDWTIRDMNWYIIIAAAKKYPFGTLIMTTLWPGRVYDRWGKVHGNHIDVYTNWPR